MIRPAGPRLTEQEAALALVSFLETRAYGEATYKQIWTYLGLPHVQFTREDRYVSRRGEPHWHTAVRNIAAHFDKPGNAVREGILVRRTRGGGGFQLASRSKS